MPHRTLPSLLCNNVCCVAFVTADFHGLSLNQEHVCPSAISHSRCKNLLRLASTSSDLIKREMLESRGQSLAAHHLFQITTVRCFHFIDFVACDPHVLDLSLTQAGEAPLDSCPTALTCAA
jgi:hypothetical protein